MENTKEYLESIHEIRSIMERSSKFISLSGFSGIAAGLTAIVSGTIAHVYTDYGSYRVQAAYVQLTISEKTSSNNIQFFLTLGIATLVIAISLAFLFTHRHAKQKKLPLWNNTAKRVLTHMLIPLVSGGMVILISTFVYHLYILIAPACLIFYGLGLVSASKYTIPHTLWLGIAQIVLGLCALLLYGYGLYFWILGFGVFHIIYGIIVYFQYNNKQ